MTRRMPITTLECLEMLPHLAEKYLLAEATSKRSVCCAAKENEFQTREKLNHFTLHLQQTRSRLLIQVSRLFCETTISSHHGTLLLSYCRMTWSRIRMQAKSEWDASQAIITGAPTWLMCCIHFACRQGLAWAYFYLTWSAERGPAPPAGRGRQVGPAWAPQEQVFMDHSPRHQCSLSVCLSWAPSITFTLAE